MTGAIAAVVVASLAWYEWPSSTPEPAKGTTSTAPARPRATTPGGMKAPAGEPGTVEVKLKALAAEREEPGEGSRNPFRLKFIGILERANGVKWAVLTDGKSGTMFGKDGDIIDGRYVIVKIGTESIEMTYPDGRGRQVIRLTGQ